MSIFRKPDAYAHRRGEGLLKMDGLLDYAHMGDWEALKIKPDQEFIERYSKNYATKTLAKRVPVKNGATLEFTLLERTPDIKRIIFGAVGRPVQQEALPATTVNVATVRKGGVFPLGARDVTVTGVEVNGQALQAGGYRVDRRTGLVQIYDGGENVTVHFTAAAVTDGRQRFGGYSTPTQRGAFIMRGLDAVSPVVELVTVHIVEFTLSSETDLIGGDDLDQVQVTGTVYPDLSQADGRDQLFTVEEIPAGDPA